MAAIRIARNDPTIPAANAGEVTPDDANDIAYASRCLFVGNAGNLKATMLDGNTVTFVNLPVGFHPLAVTRVWSTGTTANNIIALW